MIDNTIIADMREIKQSIKNIQKNQDVLSTNLDMDRQDISQIKIEMATLNSQVYEMSQQLARQTTKIAQKVADATEDIAQDTLSKIVKQGKKAVLLPWWKQLLHIK